LTLFIDASAFIAGEPERPRVAARIVADPDPLWSAMTCWEAMAALRHSYQLSIEEARDEVERSAAAMELRLVRIDSDELSIALDAYERYGKGADFALTDLA
jgi:ribonuclease VapC